MIVEQILVIEETSKLSNTVQRPETSNRESFSFNFRRIYMSFKQNTTLELLAWTHTRGLSKRRILEILLLKFRHIRWSKIGLTKQPSINDECYCRKCTTKNRDTFSYYNFIFLTELPHILSADEHLLAKVFEVLE